MVIHLKGIVLKCIKYGETSLICTLYTDKHGIQQYIINGVRRAKAKTKINLFRPMSILELVVIHKPNKAINRIKEAKFSVIYGSIPFHLVKGSIGLFMIEVAQKSIKEEEENPDLFHFLLQSFQLLDQTSAPLKNFPIYFLIHLSSYLGFLPDFRNTVPPFFFDLKEGQFATNRPSHNYFLASDLSEHLLFFLDQQINEALNLSIPKKDRQQLLNRLIDYYRLHVEGFLSLNSPGILNEVLG